jgi:hypothetical protein
VIGFCYNSKRVELYDPSQARDESGKWAGSGSSSIPTEAKAKHDEASKTPVVYHGTSAEVLKSIREKGLRASRSGVWGKGVYATSSIETALEYGALKSTNASKIMGKPLIGLIEVASQGFAKVSEYSADSKRHGRKASGIIDILLSDKDVPSSNIKSMKIFDAREVRKWIFEGGDQPKPIATKNLQEGSIFVPIIIDETAEGLEVEYVGSPKDSCPVATQDIKTNLKNRKHAVDDASYGPANPKEPNEEFWKSMAKNFNTDVEEAKTMRCGNCAAFNKTSRMLACIKKGIGEDADEVAKAGDLGFCEFFDFKCASLRTCSAWVVGGPITDKDEKKNLDCGTGAGGFKSGNTCSKGGGGAEEKVKKLVEQIKKEDPKADVGSELVRRGADSLVKAVSGAAVKATYGVTKAKEIAKWVRSSEGQKFMGNVASGLRLTGAGAIGALRGIHNARFKILVSGLINPALVPYFVSASAMKGFFDGAVKEYRNEGGGRQISNAIRSKIGIKPMQAFVQTISLQAKNPPIEDVVAYLTDVLRVSIDEAIDGKRTFEITSFYDPSQARDESGKWTGGGSGATTSQVEPERVQAIEKELRATGYEVDTVPKKEEMAELKTWAKSLAEKKYTPEDAERIAVGLKDYVSPSPLVDGGFRDVNNFLRGKQLSEEKIERSLETLNALQMAFDGGPKYDGDVVYRGSKSSSVYESIKKSYTHNVAKNIREGSILSNKGFFSATKSEDIANEFAGYMPKKSQISMSQSQIFMKISNAKNKGIVMPMFAGIGREKEVLFPEKTKIKVTKVKRIENNAPESWAKRGIPKTYATFIEGEIL